MAVDAFQLPRADGPPKSVPVGAHAGASTGVPVGTQGRCGARVAAGSISCPSTARNGHYVNLCANSLFDNDPTSADRYLGGQTTTYCGAWTGPDAPGAASGKRQGARLVARSWPVSIDAAAARSATLPPPPPHRGTPKTGTRPPGPPMLPPARFTLLNVVLTTAFNGGGW